jgi:predicted MFS family arabinose efflux permease
MSKTNINSKKAIGAAIYLGVVGPALFIIQPAFVQGLVNSLGFSEQQVGYVASLEMWGIALTTVLLTFFTRKLSWHKVLYAATIAAALGNLLSTLSTDFTPFVVLRFITGMGSGALISLSFTALGLTANPDRNFGWLIVGVLSYGAAGFVMLPVMLDNIGMTGVLIFFALFNVSALPFIRYLPKSGDEQVEADNPGKDLSRMYKALAVGTLFIYFTAQGVVWAYLVLLGTDAGISESHVTTGLTLSQFTGIAGAFTAALVASRFGRIGPLVLGIFLSVISLALLTGQFTALIYGLAVCLFNFAWNQTHPYLLGALASFDRTGRLVVFGIAAQFIGIALGPALAAAVIGDGSYSTIVWIGIALFIVSVATILPPLMREQTLQAST